MAFQVGAILGLKDTFTATIKGIKQENQKFRKDIQSTQKDLNNTFEKKRQLKIDTSSARSSIVSLQSAITGLGSALGVGAAAYGVEKISSAALKLASDAEQANIAFTTMLGSPDKATKFIADMTKFANKTPFELPEVRDAAKKMLAFGFAADSVIPMLTGVGNASAGLGLGKEGIDRITLALGQMKAKAKVQGGEMMQLTEAGIPAWQMLADKMHISTGEVMKMSEKGLIPADKAIQTLIEGMNKRFPDMMVKQSKSLAGLWSTMKDTFNNSILLKWGEGISSALKPRFEKIATWIDANGQTIDRWGQKIQSVVAKVADGIATKFESAFNYVQVHFLSNPKFTSLPDLKSKIAFVFEDIYNTFKTWLSSGGQSQLNLIAESAMGKLADSIEFSAPRLAKAGLTVGKSLGTALIDGLMKTINESPVAAAIIGAVAGGAAGSVIPVLGTGVGAVVGGAAGVAQHYTDKGTNALKKSDFAKDSVNFMTKFSDAIGWNALMKPKVNGSHANGLSNVPHNGYVAELHKGERVLTASENRNYNGNSNLSVVVNVNGSNMTVSEILDQFVPQLKLTLSNM